MLFLNWGTRIIARLFLQTVRLFRFGMWTLISATAWMLEIVNKKWTKIHLHVSHNLKISMAPIFKRRDRQWLQYVWSNAQLRIKQEAWIWSRTRHININSYCYNDIVCLYTLVMFQVYNKSVWAFGREKYIEIRQ